MNKFISNIEYNDFRTQIMSVEELLHYYERVKPLNNRGIRRYSIEQGSRFIETLLLGMPQLPLYVDDTEWNWLIIDGIERMDILYSFCNGKMKLTSLYFRMKEYEVVTFSSLPPFERNKILNTKIVVNVLNSGLSRSERFGIYVCLKPRMDSVSLKWCRSKIYHQQYHLIEDLALRISGPLRSEQLENRICCLLVGINYYLFLDSPTRNHIDAAANYLLEDPDLEYKLMNWEKGIEFVLSDFSKSRLSRIDPRIMDLFNTINYHLYTNGSHSISWQQFNYIFQQIPNASNVYTMDCAEIFCKNVERMLDLINR